MIKQQKCYQRCPQYGSMKQTKNSNPQYTVFAVYLPNRSPQHETAEHLNTYILIMEMTL
jgi:hypothetical protein